MVAELQNCKSLVILGGLVGDPITKKYPQLSDQINKSGIQKLLSEIDMKLVDKRISFIFDLFKLWPMTEGVLATETSDLKPLSLYAEAKVDSENYILKDLAPKGNNIYTILRFATAFGLSSRMRFDLTVNQFTRSMLLNDELVVFDADTWRPYCHVIDFARLIELVDEADEKP